MRWFALSFRTTHEASDLLAEYVRSLGADGVEVQDAEEIKAIIQDPASLTYADEGFINSLDSQVKIRAYFSYAENKLYFSRHSDFMSEGVVRKEAGSLETLEHLIVEQLSQFRQFIDIGEGYAGAQLIDEVDWAENWKKYYQTLRLTNRLTVNPSWIDYKPEANEIVIKMDPGSAFGTGTHETTALCAEILDQMNMEGQDVLDLGTGSGLLAIIAAKLGAASVEAIDIDPLAAAVAKQNIAANKVRVNCHAGELKQAGKQVYSILVVNIIADVILDLLTDLDKRLAEDGHLILSGIISDREMDILKAVRRLGLCVEQKLVRRDWVAMLIKKQKTADPKINCGMMKTVV